MRKFIGRRGSAGAGVRWCGVRRASKLLQLAVCALFGALAAVGLLAAPSAHADAGDFL